MAEDRKARRRDAILNAAVAELAEKGYRDTTMLAVARRASASKETLYAWFGDKSGLYAAVIARNASGAKAVIDRHLDADSDLQAALTDFGEALLDLLLGDGSVALNRAAISEAVSDPTLAAVLARDGRDATLPRLEAFLTSKVAAGHLADAPRREMASDFLGLLLGDMQTRRLLGALAAPDATTRRERARVATRKFLVLHGRSP